MSHGPEPIIVPPGLQPPIRYTSRALPPYRFIPGRFPHPTAHPDGHSYRAPGTYVHEAEPVAADAWLNSEAYLYACDLYNLGFWWEAHEAWEEIWQVTDKRGKQGHFLQGLIQVSACHLKLFVGHMDGVRRLLATSMEHLGHAQHPDKTFMGLAVDRFVDDIRAYYARAPVAPADLPRHDVAAYPYLVLDERE